MKEIRLDGRVAVITGGAGGLGFEYAKLLSTRGAKVVINDNAVGEDGVWLARRAAEAIRCKGGVAVEDTNNAADKEGAKAVIQSAISAFNQVDIVIHNAGITNDKPFLKMSEDDWSQVLDVHLNGAFYLLKAALPVMVRQNYGRIVMVTSSVGMYGLRNHSAYGAAKMGVFGLVQSLKEELEGTNVVCNLISPLAATGQTYHVLHNDLIEQLSPAPIAALVAYLCSESCSSQKETFVAAGGYYSVSSFCEGKGFTLSPEEAFAEGVSENIEKITDMTDSMRITSTGKAGKKIFRQINKNKKCER